MKLSALFADIPVLEKIHWDPHRRYKNITSDSRLVEPGDIFVACAGSRMDGHDFLTQAIYAKAAVIVCEKLPDINIPRQLIAVRVADAKACLADILLRFHGNPERGMKLMGVTGTNGKTTIAYVLHRLLTEKSESAYLGTLWYELPGRRIPALNTTPGPEVLIPLLHDIRQAGVPACVMEVSSHALEQRRVHGFAFELAMFTQLTQDHLDYHKNMESYFQSKRLLFSSFPRPRQSLINRDCPFGRRLLEENPSAKSFSLVQKADYQAVEINPSFQGSTFVLRTRDAEIPFRTRLPLRHNISNLVCALGALDMLGYDPADFRGALAEIPGVPGRMERVPGCDDFQVFVDYAHTPDAFENVLSGARGLNPGRILTLFGCGGDRDREKRPLMTRAACRFSDLVVMTSDNPRSEDPVAILADMKKGLPRDHDHSPQVFEIMDRREAIDKLISLAMPGDAVFILGKGHEDYQILGDTKIPFDDRQIAQECLKRKSRVFLS